MTDNGPPKETPLRNRGCESILLNNAIYFARSTRDDSCHSVGSNVILAHATAVQLYRQEFKSRQGGQIGITLNGDWAMPYDDNPESESSCIAIYLSAWSCD